MYAALGVGTLIKGAVAVVLPGLVIGGYILLTRRWSLVLRMEIARGALVYFAVVAPWYLWSEVRNPGYLNYFFWEEHFVRYTSTEFERSQGWYYFIVVTAVGFFPWIAVLPQTARHMWRERGDDMTRFLALWALVPVVFFSFSRSQLPQYILPIFPSLALLTGRHLAERISGAGAEGWQRILLPWACVISVLIYLLLGAAWPNVLVRHVRPAVAQNVAPLAASGGALLLILGIFFNGHRKKAWRGWGPVYCSTATGFALFFIVLAQMTTAVSQDRSAKAVAQTAAFFIAPEDRVVFYDTYLTGIPFYLSLDRPSWIVQDEEKEKILGSSYLAARRPPAAAGHGQVVFSFVDFAQQWNRKDVVLRVIVKEKNFRRLSSNVGAVPKILTKVDEYLLVTNR
jgi:4-amino-4-deoxy-L-arabinose transferase-like glycosyltransferase